MNKKLQIKAGYKIPKSFTIAGVSHKVIMDEIINIEEDLAYGYYQPSKQEIHLATHMPEKESLVELSEDLVLNVFGHELAHAFQFYLGDDFSEAQAQTLGNLLSEFLKTAK